MIMDFESEWELNEEAAEVESLFAPESAKSRPLSSAQLQAAIQRHRSAHAKLMKAVAAMSPHIVVRNGRPHFTLPARSTHEAAVKLGVDPRVFSHLHKSLKRAPPLAHRSGRAGEMEWESPARCAGVTDFARFWWGMRLRLDDCQAQKLASDLKTGAAGGGLVCLFVTKTPPFCGILATSAAFYGNIIDWMNTRGGKQGVKIYLTYAAMANPALATPIVLPQ